jgi:hypothetical protein
MVLLSGCQSLVGKCACLLVGALLRDNLAVERHAARTEHANYEESSEIVPEVTPAQRAAKVEELKAKIAQRRVERELAEKEAERTREIQRRKDGQKIQAVREQLEAEQRKRDAEAAKRVRFCVFAYAPSALIGDACFRNETRKSLSSRRNGSGCVKKLRGTRQSVRHSACWLSFSVCGVGVL